MVLGSNTESIRRSVLEEVRQQTQGLQTAAAQVEDFATVVEGLGADLTVEKGKIAAVNPPTSANPGKVWIQGPSSPKFDDMETVILDHVIERSATPATNRVNMQTVLDRIAPDGSGKQVRLFIPPRWDEYGVPDPIVMDRETGGEVRVLDVPSYTTIEGAGAGSTLKLADDQPNYSRILSIGRESSPGVEHVAVRNLRLDGNKANNDPPGNGGLDDTHHYNLFIYEGRHVLIEDVESVDSTGDGGAATGGGATSDNLSRDIKFHRFRATGNLRNPLTVEQAEEVWVDKSYLICHADSPGQAVDSEPYANIAVGALWVTDSILGHDDPSRYVLTVGGKSATYPRRGVFILGNEFRDGQIQVFSVEDLSIQGNRGRINRIHGHAHVVGADISRNIWDVTTPNSYAVISEYSLGATPDQLTLADNQLTMVNDGGGYRLSGVSNHKIRGGFVRRPGTADTSRHGVSIQATQNMANIEVTGIEIDNYFTPVRGIPISGSTLDGLLIGGLTIDGSGSGYASIDLYSAASWISNLVMPPSVIRNNVGPALTLHTGTPYVMSGVPRWRAVWSCNGDPNGQITERIGAQAFRRDGGAGTTMYVKESGTDTNTGWVAK